MFWTFSKPYNGGVLMWATGFSHDYLVVVEDWRLSKDIGQDIKRAAAKVWPVQYALGQLLGMIT